MKFYGKIEGIRYKASFKMPVLHEYSLLKEGIENQTAFIYKLGSHKFAVSWWVSPKRTRSYPYARVYNTLQFSGKKVTIIPVMKDEGEEGDRDFIQWDTISLMSLLGVYVILGYYVEASKKSQGKITSQRFDYEYLKAQFEELSNWQSDALHWNINQVNKIGDLMNMAIEAYERISQRLNVRLKDIQSAKNKAEEVYRDLEKFKNHSRTQSEKAQQREVLTTQPKENITGEKAPIDIENYLGGLYHFTIDEAYVNLQSKTACIVEAKNSKSNCLPSEEDIKDGLLKMIIFLNLSELYYEYGDAYIRIEHINPFLKLTGVCESFKPRHKVVLEELLREAKENNLKIILNQKVIDVKGSEILYYTDFMC